MGLLLGRGGTGKSAVMVYVREVLNGITKRGIDKEQIDNPDKLIFMLGANPTAASGQDFGNSTIHSLVGLSHTSGYNVINKPIGKKPQRLFNRLIGKYRHLKWLWLDELS